MPNTSTFTIDLGEAYGIRRKPDVFMDVPDYCDVLGMSISDYAARFPECWYFLSVDLGWSDADILHSTYFWSAFMDADLQGYEQGGGSPFYRRNIIVPAGKWFYNRELRKNQGTVRGEGPFNIAQLQEDPTNWKSIYGTQQNNTRLGICPSTYAGEGELSTYPVCLGSGGEYCHATRLEWLTLSGTSNSQFNDPSIRSAGFMYHNAGENSGVFNCMLQEYNDFPVLVDNFCAYVNMDGNSFFRNGVAGIGIRGCARGEMRFSFSGDYNPFAVFMFRQNTSLLSPNGVNFWPYAGNITPGGNIQMPYVKLEAPVCRSGFQSYSTCLPDIPGKGGMLARLTGRFHFGCSGGVATGEGGFINSLIQVYDDYYNGGELPFQAPLSNSSIDIRNFGTIGYYYWMADNYPLTNGHKKWIANNTTADSDLHGNGFTWRADANNRRCFDVTNPSTVLNSIDFTYEGMQPDSNAADPLVWHEDTGPLAGEGYQQVTGQAW